MKTFINAKGLEIFKLDYNGNLWLSGDLHLKPTSTITAGNINAIFAGDISIIRNAVEMDPPYLGNAEVIYYLGETTEKYTNGTWWEKYIKEYICTVDTTSNRDSQFLVYNTVFSVNGEEDTYQYNKSILDLYPTTTKIVLKAIESDGTTPYNRYWEVSYLGKDDLLLFNDCLNSNLLYSTGYNFPLSPLNADDYDEGYSTIIINVEPVYALKEISPIDWSLYMPKAGGEFTGTLHTQNVAPSESDTYILGTEAGRYKAGYFQELYADVLRTKNIEIEELQLDSFALNTSKLEVSSGDGLLITDSEDSNNVKTLDSVKFNKDNKEAFLRQDGVFALPNTNVLVVENISQIKEKEKEGNLILYKGINDNTLFRKGTLYSGIYDSDIYQMICEGVSNDQVNLITMGATNSLFGDICAAFKDLVGTDTIDNIIKNNSCVTFIYTKATNSWQIEGSDVGSISDSTYKLYDKLFSLLKGSIEKTYVELKVSFNHFVWHPLNFVTFDGNSTESKYLDITGVWKDFPKPYESIYALETDVANIGQLPLVISLADLSELPDGVILIHNTTSSITGVIEKHSKALSSKSILTDVSCYYKGKVYTASFIINKNLGSNTISIVSDWKQINNNTTISVRSEGYWDTLTADEWEYLLQRDSGARAGIMLIDGKRYIGIWADDVTDDSLLFDSTNTKEYEDLYIVAIKKKVDEGSLVLLPSTGYLLNYNVEDTTNPYYAVRDGGYYLGIDSTTEKVSVVDILNNEKFYDQDVRVAVRLVHENTNGRFSVSDTKKVDFAKGNVQSNYFCGDEYRIVNHQYSCQGSKNTQLNEWKDLIVGIKGPHSFSVGPMKEIDFTSDYYLTMS